jgi:type IV pilus assembly protein PilQ
MLATCVVGGISLALCLAVVVGPDVANVSDVAASTENGAAPETAAAGGTAAGRDVVAEREKLVAGSDVVTPRNVIRKPLPATASRAKPATHPDLLAVPQETLAKRAETGSGATTAQYIQETPEENSISAVIRFKTNEPAGASGAMPSSSREAALVAAQQSANEGEPRASTKQRESTIRGEPARLPTVPFRDKAIARPSMSKSAGSRANDGHNDGRVVQVQYQAPQYLAPRPVVAPQVDWNVVSPAAAPKPIAPRPAFGQQVDPGATSSAATPQSAAGSTPQSTSANTNNLPGAESNAGTPSTGDGISSGGQPPPSLNGPWAAGGIQPGSAQPQSNSPQPGVAMPPGPAPSEEEPEEPMEAEPRPSAAASPPRVPRAEIKAGEGDHNLTIHIQDTDLREVLDLLSDQGGLNILASNSVEGRVSASLTNVDVDTALAAILKSTGYTVRREGKFIYVGTPKDFQGMTQAGDRLGSRVYRLNYVKAADFQALIVPLLTPGGVGMISVTPPGQIGIPADVNNTNGDLYGGNETVLVRDYEGVLAQIDQVHDEIDVRPMQVAIEAMILSVELDDKNSFGVNFQFLRNEPNVAFATGDPPSSIGQVSFTNGGLQFGFLDSSLGAFINALETIGDTNVIATPRLTCLNKHRAEILIGSQQGYVNSTSQNLTSTTQAVAFLETGTQLRLRPFISNDGMIRMEVHPESSTGTVTLVGGYTLPNKDVTEVTTNVMVPDGRTVIIGGLMREELDKTSTQVPLLGSLPGIGWLFRSKTETIARHELIVLITPHIVYEPCASKEGEQAACDFHRRQAVYQDQMSPINTRYLGRKYFRLAQSAWAAGDGRAALRFANLSVHFDPLSRAAIDLRSDIMGGNHQGPHSGGATLAGHPADLDGKEVPSWLLDNLDPSAGSPPAVVHPMEPGQPGRIRNIVRPGGMQ